MKTWHIRLVCADGRPVGHWRASARYLLAWLWFVPALASLKLAGLGGAAAVAVALVVGVFAYAALARLHPSRQFVHDIVCGTRLVSWRPAAGGVAHNAPR
jgi:uncharacterized RDD family membrane protein YckC